MCRVIMSSRRVPTSMSHCHHEKIVILYSISLESLQSRLEAVVHALYFQVCPYARQCDIVKLVNFFLRAGILIEDLLFATLVENPSIYPHVGVVISIEEVTINHLHRELSSTVLFNILCDHVLFGTNVELAVQPVFACIPIGLPTAEAESDTVI